LHAAHDRAAIVSQFPLTQGCGHNANRSTKALRTVAVSAGGGESDQYD
jgi:hypothetical protein